MARILMIAYTTYVFDARVKRHSEALAERGDQVDAICLASTAAKDTGPVNLIEIAIPRYRGGSRTAYIRSYIRFFVKAALEAGRRSRVQPYDLVITCSIPDLAVVSGLLPRMRGARLVLDIHDTMPELYLERFGARFGGIGARFLMLEEQISAFLADRVMAVHDLHRSRLVEAGIPAEKIHVVMNSPDPRIFQRQPAAQIPDDKFTIVCHGTVTHRLGLDVVIKAIDLLRDRIPNLKFKLIGGGDHLAKIRNMIEQLGIGSYVDFAGSVPLEKLPAALNGAHLGLVPNLASSATHLMLPVKLLEYAVLGIPIIASRLRTIEHYFSNDSLRFFTPNDPADLARAIDDLYRNPAVRRAIAERARLVAEQLSWPRQREKYFAAIDPLLPQKSSNGTGLDWNTEPEQGGPVRHLNPGGSRW